MGRIVLLLGIWLCGAQACAEGLTADRLGVIFNQNDAASVRIANYYAAQRHIPARNLVGLSVPDRASLSRAELQVLRESMIERLPSAVQSLLLLWSRPYAVECMSITSAFAAGYQPGFCEPGCGPTTADPLFDTAGWLPADTAGWLPAMLLPTQDENLARAVIDRGVRADGSEPQGTVYLVRTQDAARNVRAAEYRDTELLLGGRINMRELTTPVETAPTGAIAYFTGASSVDELRRIGFLPGAVADHLTSTGGMLEGGTQMPAVAWLLQGATASYGTVSEPCNRLQKFPDVTVLLRHYLNGETLLEAYWKSVAMPGQGLFVGEPLARPYAPAP
jgi:uncharacterized protein (TIGR03790 family)